MIIDENKKYATYKTEYQQDQVRKLYSDRIVILLELDYITTFEKNKQIKYITNKGQQEYQKILQQVKLTKIIQSQNLQQSYTNWTNAVENAINKVKKNQDEE